MKTNNSTVYVYIACSMLLMYMWPFVSHYTRLMVNRRPLSYRSSHWGCSHIYSMETNSWFMTSCQPLFSHQIFGSKFYKAFKTTKTMFESVPMCQYLIGSFLHGVCRKWIYSYQGYEVFFYQFRVQSTMNVKFIAYWSKS